MQIDDLFHSPADTIARLAAMQVHLYREDAGLQNYFHALDEGLFYGSSAQAHGRSSLPPALAWPLRWADSLSRFTPPAKIKADVLFCPTPYFGRSTENRFLTRTLLGLAETGAEVLCLLPAYAPVRQNLEARLTEAGYRRQVTFLDPAASFNAIEGRTRALAARQRGRAAFDAITQILEPHGLAPTTLDVARFEEAAHHLEAWERWAPFLEFDAVVARCHWYEFCSPACHTGLARGKPVVTFQQGVVGHSLDLPIVASQFVSFGEPSAVVLAEANRRFFAAAGRPEPPVAYVPAGALFDTITPLPQQFSQQTVLLIDLHSVAGNTWGDECQVQALVQLAEKLLAAGLPLRRLVIRPHPQWSGFDLSACFRLVREHRDVCELSHPAWSLEDDLRRSSVVVGIWSGALTIASACGLPTLFLDVEDGLKTRDLDCFSPQQTLSREAALVELTRLLTDPRHYAEASRIALANAGQYYAGGAEATLDGAFFSPLLRKPDPQNRRPAPEAPRAATPSGAAPVASAPHAQGKE